MEANEREYVLARLILKVANTIIKNRNSHLKQLDLTAAQADSLQFFLAQEGATITDLKEHLGITHQTARGIVQRLAEKGLISLHQSEQDGRYLIISPTHQGVAIGHKLRKNGIRTGHKLLKGMDSDQQQTFLHLLQIALVNIQENEGKCHEQY